MKSDKIQISFVAENAESVTGSCILVKTPDRSIVLECGLFQNCGNVMESYKINSRDFPFSARDVDYLFVCHNHADHVALAPRLYAKGCTAPMLMPNGSYEITKILLDDSAKIMGYDAKSMSEEYKRNYAPVYSEIDVDNCLSHCREYPMNEVFELDEFVKFRFIPSGHILNSAQLELWVTCGNLVKKIAYTSDLGNVHVQKYYTNTFKPVEKADVVIGECTYAHEPIVADKKMRKKELVEMENAIRQTCIVDKGRVLIPVFANDRCQNMLTVLYDMFSSDSNFKIPVLVDSPMAIRCCEAYGRILKNDEAKKWDAVLGWANVQFVQTSIDSKKWAKMKTPLIVLASSGMLVKGRSVNWVNNILPRPHDRIIFCGFTVKNSMGSLIKDGTHKSISVFGKKIPNRCKVTSLSSFTSHCQRDSLISYYGTIDCQKVVLVHGEDKEMFIKDLQAEISKNNRTSKVISVKKGQKLII